MVLDLIILASIPTVTGVCFATSEQRNVNARRADAKRMAKFKLVVYSELTNPTTNETVPGPVHGTTVALRHNKVYLVPRHPSLRDTATHEFHGFYIEYPGEEKPPIMGLVSSIPFPTPMLGWVYADRETGMLRYGNKSASCEHFFGKWDWISDESRVTFRGGERLFAVEMGSWEGIKQVEGEVSEEELEDAHEMRWRVFYDMNKDGLDAVLGREEDGGRRRFPIKWFRNPTGEPIGA